MAVLPFQPTPFFANKNRAFWNLQLAGWGGEMVLRAVSSIAGGREITFMLIVLMEGLAGFSISLILAVIYHQVIHKRAIVTWGVTAIVLAIAVVLYAFIEAWVLSLSSAPDTEGSIAKILLGIYILPLTLLGAWSALYYAINFFLQAEEQADRLERLQLQATGAQLAMLRYQLNPHFLFNTLNSISTLVLLKQTEPANAMLGRLSSFLRHTLVNEPDSRVPLEQEVETIKLYLEIERMRFEDRLRTEFRLDPVALNGLLPSMLLQPLVENAIKYAVSPQEEGARITLSALLVGNRLRISVSDTGPGLHSSQKSPSLIPVNLGINATQQNTIVSTGVGLANTRDRLTQAYGDNHLFETRTPPSGGFIVIIEVPYETEDNQEESHSEAEATPVAAATG